ncbi:MAG: trypsin-like serine protease [Myxococcales bacterium]|nr:trypsin-like serine protease [Myxococcales bacterium]
MKPLAYMAVVFLSFFHLLGCVSPTADAETGSDTDALDGSRIGGHPNTVIFEFEGLDLRQPTGDISDGEASDEDYSTLRGLTCAGMLVAPNLILTAAHCVGPLIWMFPLDEHSIRFFNHTTARTDVTFQWRDLAVYRHHKLDIAFIQLPRDVSMPEAVSLNLSESSVIPETGIPVWVDGRIARDNGNVNKQDTRTGELLISDVRNMGLSSGGFFAPSTSAYYAEWSQKYPLLSEPGDSGGPVYVQASNGDAHVYGVMSGATAIPEGRTVAEYCSEAAGGIDACSMRISNLSAAASWANEVFHCASGSGCSATVLATRSVGYGMDRKSFVFEQLCPEDTTLVGQYSMRFSSDQPRTYDVAALYEGGPFTHWLLPEMYESIGNGEKPSASVEQFFAGLSVGVFLFPSALVGSEPKVTYQRCTIEFQENLSLPFQKHLGQVCPSGTQEVMSLYISNDSEQEGAVTINLTAEGNGSTKTIRQAIPAEGGEFLDAGFYPFDLSDLAVSVSSGKLDAFEVAYSYYCEFI